VIIIYYHEHFSVTRVRSWWRYSPATRRPGAGQLVKPGSRLRVAPLRIDARLVRDGGNKMQRGRVVIIGQRGGRSPQPRTS